MGDELEMVQMSGQTGPKSVPFWNWWRKIKYSDNHGYGEFWKSDAADDTTYVHCSLK